jgi:hypothetical protein
MRVCVINALHLRIEVPLSMEKSLFEAKNRQVISVDSNALETSKHEEEKIEGQSSWLWFELTPFEVGCDELGGTRSNLR